VVGAGVDRGEAGQRAVVGDERVAPALHLGEAGVILRRAGRPALERSPDRRGVDVAHQLADVLELAPAPLVGLDAARLGDGVDEPLRQVELRDAPGVERHQRAAQVLQVVHRLLAAGLGRGRRLRSGRRRRAFGAVHRPGECGGGGRRFRERAFAMIADRVCAASSGAPYAPDRRRGI